MATQGETVVPPPEREAYLRRAQSVVTESNERAAAGDDVVWAAQNGGNQGVMPDGGVKPDEWKRGLYAKDGDFGHVHNSEATGIENLEQFRTQITKDLNFNQVFDEFKSPTEFEDALAEKYGADPEQGEQIREIAKNLWAYGTTGTDVMGNTNVAELQGLLFALDPSIAEASNSNTKHQNTFTIPGTDMELNSGGDDLYGRATMLECRLLASILDDPLIGQEKTVLDSIPEVLPELENEPTVDNDVFGRSHFLMDISSSMFNDHEMLRDYFDTIDFGDTHIGSMTSHYDGLKWHDENPVEMEEGRDIMKRLDGLNLNRDNYQRKRGAAGRISPAFDQIGGGHEESCVTAALEVLDGIDKDKVDNVNGEQIVLATDEADSNALELRRLRDQANEKGVVVKVLYFVGTGANPRMIEINVNEISDETLEEFEREASEVPELNGAGWAVDRKVNDFNETHSLARLNKNDNRETDGELHMGLDWKQLAEREKERDDLRDGRLESLDGVKTIEDRPSRRDP